MELPNKTSCQTRGAPTLRHGGEDMFAEHEVVRLKRSVSGIEKGSEGTIVFVFPPESKLCMVEFAGSTVYESSVIDALDADLEDKAFSAE